MKFEGIVSKLKVADSFVDVVEISEDETQDVVDEGNELEVIVVTAFVEITTVYVFVDAVMQQITLLELVEEV